MTEPVRGCMQTEFHYETGPHPIAGTGIREITLHANTKGRGPFIEFAPITHELSRKGTPRWPPVGVVAVRRAPEGFYYIVLSRCLRDELSSETGPLRPGHTPCLDLRSDLRAPLVWPGEGRLIHCCVF